MASRDMVKNSDLPIEIQMRVRDLFEKHYAQVERPAVPAVENEMKPTVLDNKFIRKGHANFKKLRNSG